MELTDLTSNEQRGFRAGHLGLCLVSVLRLAEIVSCCFTGDCDSVLTLNNSIILMYSRICVLSIYYYPTMYLYKTYCLPVSQ